MDVNCCVNTHTLNPSCLPEKARSINLLERFFRSLETAQSSRMIRVFVPEKRSDTDVRRSLISSELLESGDKTKNRLSPRANPR